MLKLNLELLAVETFEISLENTGQGTVHAHEWSYVEPSCTFATSGGDLFCAAVCNQANARKPRRTVRGAGVPRR